VARLNIAPTMARIFGNRLREVVPRAHALVRIVVGTLATVVFTSFEDRADRSGEVPGIGRSARLVENHFQLLFFFRQAQHRLHEIRTVLRIEPRRAKDQVATARCAYRLLAVELRHSVNARGRTLLLLAARRVVGIAAENIVRRNVYQHPAALLHRIRKISNRRSVQQLRTCRVVLGTVHIRIGCAVHHDADPVFTDEALHRLRVRDVEPQGIVPRNVRKKVTVRRDG